MSSIPFSTRAWRAIDSEEVELRQELDFEVQMTGAAVRVRSSWAIGRGRLRCWPEGVAPGGDVREHVTK